MAEELNIPHELATLIFGKDNILLKDQGKIFHIYGEAGTGKTTLALQIALSYCIKDKRVFYLDTEGKITGSKLKEMSDGNNFKIINKNLKFFIINKFEEQQKLIQKLDYFFQTQKVDMIIVDTITNHYRQAMLFQKDAKNLYEKLAFQVANLNKIAKKKFIPILLINQATMRKQKSELEEGETVALERIDPVAKAIMSYWSDKEIILINHGWGKFEARIPREYEGRVKFSINEKGIAPYKE
ncbi:MAG: AAA family ATPase [Candidatus Thorarchaeota archaeon]